MTHTPGPWEEYDPGEHWWENGRLLGADGTRILAFLDASDADRHLVSTALELLEACERALAEMTEPWPPDDWDTTRERLTAVIAKANGAKEVA